MRRLLLNLYPPALTGDRAQDHYTGWFMTSFALVLLVSTIAACLFALSAIPRGHDGSGVPDGLGFIAIGLLVGAAGFAVGGLVGFLFGVPRLRSGGADTGAGGGEPQVISNTNLEQLSDWLTKILVGVGLVQIHEVDPLLSRFRDQIDQALATSAGHPLPGAGLAACLILIGAVIAGFLAAYLKSKTDLMHAFREPIAVVQSALGGVAQKLIVGAARDILDRPSSLPDDCSRETAAKLVQFVPPDSHDPDLYQLVGLAQVVLGNFGPAAEALKAAIDLRAGQGLPGDPALVAFATRALALAGETDTARSLSAGPLPDGAMTGDQVEGAFAAMFAQLYSRGGYDAAIALGERLARDPGASKSGRLWLYLARAWGQRHAALISHRTAHDADPITPGDADARRTIGEAIDTAREKALAAARMAVQLNQPRNGAALRQSCNPAAAEHDLASLSADPAFVALLGDAPADAATQTSPDQPASGLTPVTGG